MPWLAHRTLLVSTAVFALARASLAQDVTTTTAPAPIEQTTEVQGEIPQDLVGRWLVVGHVKLPDGKRHPVARPMEIGRADGHLSVDTPLAQVPPSVNQNINAAIEKGNDWTPSPEDLRTVANEWGKLDPPESDIKGIQHKLIAASDYPPEFKEDEDTKDTRFAISTQENYGGRRGVLRTYTLYGVREQTPKTIAGSFVTTTLAAAPLPIPITLKGDFTAYRLEAASPPPAPKGTSWLDRLFAGCQR